MKKWMILLAAVLMLLAGCGKEPAVAGLSNEEFHRYFADGILPRTTPGR